MNIKITQVGPSAVMRVEGRMDAASQASFDETCVRTVADGAVNVVADLTGLTYISSAGIGSFLKMAKNLEPKNGEVVLAGLSGLVRDVFELTRIITIFRVFNSTEEALAALASR